jgi:hypothetical protein
VVALVDIRVLGVLVEIREMLELRVQAVAAEAVAGIPLVQTLVVVVA